MIPKCIFFGVSHINFFLKNQNFYLNVFFWRYLTDTSLYLTHEKCIPKVIFLIPNDICFIPNYFKIYLT